MWTRVASVLLVLAGTAGCTTVSDTPATAPSTTSSSVTTAPEATTTTVEVPETTTTLDRVAEIEAIFLDLEHRRLQAILDQDEAAYRAVFANPYYEEESMVVFDSVQVLDPKGSFFNVSRIIADFESCIAVEATIDQSLAVAGGGTGTREWVFERADEGWGFSWIGSGWTCEGPHPLSP